MRARKIVNNHINSPAKSVHISIRQNNNSLATEALNAYTCIALHARDFVSARLHSESLHFLAVGDPARFPFFELGRNRTLNYESARLDVTINNNPVMCVEMIMDRCCSRKIY